MRRISFTLTFAAFCLVTGCTNLAGFSDVTSRQLNTLTDSKAAYLEKVKRLDCVVAGVLDLKCYEMKKAAKEGFEDAFVDTGNGVYVLDPMKFEYLKALEERNCTTPAQTRAVKSATVGP